MTVRKAGYISVAESSAIARLAAPDEAPDRRSVELGATFCVGDIRDPLRRRAAEVLAQALKDSRG